jgi:hypothetical protein
MANRFQNVLAPLVEGDRKRRIREALVSSNIESEEELKQIVAGKRKEVIALFQRNLGLNELDACALAGVVLPSKGKHFSSSFFFLTFCLTFLSIFSPPGSSTIR